MTFNTTCYAILSDGTNVPAFTLGTDVDIGFTVRVAKADVVGLWWRTNGQETGCALERQPHRQL
jgi:hypothetical protein